MDKEVLRKQIMVSQFVNAVGCPPDQATQFLQAAQWQWDVSFCVALSMARLFCLILWPWGQLLHDLFLNGTQKRSRDV